ncbi:MAG: adenosine deaminase [Acidimicrobiales bacterium]
MQVTSTDTDAVSLRAIPKVLLHDHFDGGLRPATVVELAREQGYRGLPTYDPDDLATWFHRGADRRSLELYLETFVHTVAVLRTPEAIERVAAECAEDLAADGVVYAESRLAPGEIVDAGSSMTMDHVIAAMARGFAAAPALGLEVRLIVCAMRNRPDSTSVAEAAVRGRDLGVVGFDIAGPEAGYPPSEHRDAFDIARAGHLGITIHAGEAAGVGSIREAMVECGANRLGHGVHVIDEVGVDDDGEVVLGPVATMVHETGICLELCPTSNVHTSAAGVTSLADHPIDRLAEAGFAVTVNTDNRLMSDVSVLDEYAGLATTFGWGAAEFDAANRTALDAAFCDEATRSRLARVYWP